mmetsp:Transcript_24261/g.67608  ORF Transcript_24261/g.67608 Transcript_24261/m.67608 type:complete len:106 (-) Transcript_24261:44-361(-)
MDGHSGRGHGKNTGKSTDTSGITYNMIGMLRQQAQHNLTTSQKLCEQPPLFAREGDWAETVAPSAASARARTASGTLGTVAKIDAVDRAAEHHSARNELASDIGQ